MHRTARRGLSALAAAGLAASIVGSATAARADSSFTNPTSGTVSTYQVVSDALSWTEARDAAASAPDPTTGCSDHLAVITSQAEQDYVNAQLGGRNDLWLGAAKNGAGDFAWVTGEPFDFTAWAGGEPNNFNGIENAVQIAFFGGDSLWNDIDGNRASGYLVEHECPAPAPQRPVITMVDPGSGPATGGNEVTLTGTGFTGARQVTFGGTRASSYTVESDTSIVVTVPAYTGDLGRRGKSVQVRVQSAGSNVKKSFARYRYLPTPR